jgi:cyclophilin family peptidyl-prolyl cis-trans isomerase
VKKEVLAISGVVLMVALGAIFLISSFESSKDDNVLSTQVINQAATPAATQKSENMQPLMQIDQKKTYQAVLSTTEGDIIIDLNAKATPITVNNFVSLIKNGFYNGTIFHRVIDGFMIQGGDPEGTGRGGPGYRFDDEPFEGEYTRGTVAMANAGPNTNGSQFFIMHADKPLPKNYVIFGKVASGMDVVDKIATAQVKPGGEGSSPVNPVKITSASVIEK